jgi:hypothetical protein
VLRRVVALAAICLAAGVLAACGSSSNSSSTSSTSTSSAAAGTVAKATIIREGDAICRKLNAVTANGLRSLSSTGITSITKLLAATSAQLKQVAPILAKSANALSTEAQQLAALGTPTKDAALFNQVVADVRKTAAFAQAGVKAAAHGDTKAFVAAVGGNGAGGIAAHGPQFGFHACDLAS